VRYRDLVASSGKFLADSPNARFLPAVLIVLLWPAATLSVVAAQDKLGPLLVRLSKGPVDGSILYKLEGQPPDPRILPALRDAFDKVSAKTEKQQIAAALLRLGEKTNTYFDYLAGYATIAIEDRTPTFFMYDSKGQPISGQLDPGFENWCAQNRKNPRDVARLLLYDYPQDVQVLASAAEPRATELFRRGLQSTNTLVIAYSAQGLGRLKDSTAVALIRKTCDLLTVGDKLAIAMQIPWFGSIEAEQLLQDLAPEPNMRDYLKRMVYLQQLLDLNNARRRAGLEPIPIPAAGK
jgi:hypothetical protein